MALLRPGGSGITPDAGSNTMAFAPVGLAATIPAGQAGPFQSLSVPPTQSPGATGGSPPAAAFVAPGGAMLGSLPRWPYDPDDPRGPHKPPDWWPFTWVDDWLGNLDDDLKRFEDMWENTSDRIKREFERLLGVFPQSYKQKRRIINDPEIRDALRSFLKPVSPPGQGTGLGSIDNVDTKNFALCIDDFAALLEQLRHEVIDAFQNMPDLSIQDFKESVRITNNFARGIGAKAKNVAGAR